MAKKLVRRKANTKPIPWSKEEEDILIERIKSSKGSETLKSLFPNRSSASIRSKTRKLRIKHDLFGNSYRAEKSNFTSQIASLVRPQSVFDGYAGAGHQTLKWLEVADTVYAAEIMRSKLEQFTSTMVSNGYIISDSGDCHWRLFIKDKKKIFFYSGDAISAAADLKVNNLIVDIIDLDTCGSTIPSISTFLLLLNPKHLVITHGEFHSLRFGRVDVIKRLLTHRDINDDRLPASNSELARELDISLKLTALRSHNETKSSYWLELKSDKWLGASHKGMLRRHYKVTRPKATSDCINELLEL